MKDILFFSHNQKKIIEVKQIFKNSKTKVYDLNSFEKVEEPKETGKTFESNAKIKSKYGQKLFNIPCFADDSGFCVEALKNDPGVKSKRFLEKFSNNKKAFDYIISNVIKKQNNKAFFVTAISLTLKENHHIIFLGHQLLSQNQYTFRHRQFLFVLTQYLMFNFSVDVGTSPIE